MLNSYMDTWQYTCMMIKASHKLNSSLLDLGLNNEEYD